MTRLHNRIKAVFYASWCYITGRSSQKLASKTDFFQLKLVTETQVFSVREARALLNNCTLILKWGEGTTVRLGQLLRSGIAILSLKRVFSGALGSPHMPLLCVLRCNDRPLNISDKGGFSAQVSSPILMFWFLLMDLGSFGYACQTRKLVWLRFLDWVFSLVALIASCRKSSQTFFFSHLH